MADFLTIKKDKNVYLLDESFAKNYKELASMSYVQLRKLLFAMRADLITISLVDDTNEDRKRLLRLKSLIKIRIARVLTAMQVLKTALI